MFLDSKTQTDKLKEFDSFNKVISNEPSRKWRKYLLVALCILAIILLLPWTQNIQSPGIVSTLQPNQRPQQINSVIAGRIVKWHIQDGQVVKKGDTLLQLAEVKEEYLDSSLLDRVDEQIRAKSASIDFYRQKANTTEQQQQALLLAMKLKIQQLQNKYRQYRLQVQSDSISFIAARNQLRIATEQLDRQKELYEAGLKSLTELEQRQQYFQDAQAKKISAENKFYSSKNELINIRLDLSATEQEYAEKISKTTGERFSALSQVSTTESEVAKLRNQYTNYKQRRGFYVITAPQSGQVLRTVKSGIGEVVKDGEQLMQIVPTQFEPAVEMFISPVDMPLIKPGQRVRLQFDGFPAIVFSGWPQASYGTFGGKIATVDPSINPNGKFRIWVVPDGEKPWPQQLRYGGGTQGIALLKDVPIIYELWRQLNGFPPEYYKGPSETEKKEKNEK
ncbi:HlyD family secretion protein [Pedobacter sp. SYSU D00535]|uniref:HlyD family secretion protein n=1 Tax=Pedobacter sp. SYSU D00535 TaxID=2810308 RepID=UPI001A967BA8|nr:HlyD family efflux transporter periplasmic adaptor subunit [Pedobacter sp. SYSU D00535]